MTIEALFLIGLFACAVWWCASVEGRAKTVFLLTVLLVFINAAWEGVRMLWRLL